MNTFKIRIPEKAPDHVFGIATPHHMLLKLYWEIENLEMALAGEGHAVNPIAFHLYNCAVTAWHCADWAWQYGDQHCHTHLAEMMDCSVDKRAFFDAVCKRSDEINACRKIANGSKHRELDRPAPNVKAGINWYYGPDKIRMRPYAFINKTTSIDAVSLFVKAAEFWEGLFSGVGYIEGRFVE